jgi:colanic acid biosynthesis glycosyl transferase WcaI
MHLLILTHHFYPEFSGAATMQYEFAKHLVSSGHRVTVVTSYSQHHMSVNNEPNQSEELLEGIRIVRVRSLNWKRKTFIQRALQDFIIEFSFIIKGLQCSSIDIIFVMSPPITLPIMAAILKFFHKSLLILNVQDIFPELVIAMGILERNSLAIRFGEFLEKLAYSCADYLGVHSPKNRLHIVSCNVPEKKVGLVPLWLDTDLIKPQSRQNPFSDKYELNDKFVVMYAGTVGFAMGALTIPQVANLLSEEAAVQFVVIGGGNKLDEMNNEIKKLRVGNILILPPQPREDLPMVLASADVLLITLKKEITDNPNGYFRAVVPHKLLTNMASARPILLAVEETADAAEIVRISECGKVVPPEDPAALALAIMEMNENQRLLPNWGRNGRAFVCQHFDSKIQVEKIEKLLCSLHGDENYQLNNPWEKVN